MSANERHDNPNDRISARARLKISILCSLGLGDALLQMVIAQNMVCLGAQVKFYSDIATQFKPLIDDYELCHLPSESDLIDHLQDEHVILYDSSAPYIRSLPSAEEHWLMNNAICYRLSDKLPRHRTISEQQISNRLPLEFKSYAEIFKRFNATLRTKQNIFYRAPIVKQLFTVLNSDIRLSQATLSNGIRIKIPDSKYDTALIHPTSSRSVKNWPAAKYIELAELLRLKGLNPIFTVSPTERPVWVKLLGNRFKVPLIPTLTDLANLYQGARIFVGNDSGAAHLASYLGVPTVQVFRGYRKHPAWRAGWSKNKVVIARLPFRFSKKYWAHGVRVEDVQFAVNTILSATKSDYVESV